MQLPQVEASLVSVNPKDGAIRALVGGFDFKRNQFNHVMQAWRQPGSSLKPFIYSASLEKVSHLRPSLMMRHFSLVLKRQGASHGNLEIMMVSTKVLYVCVKP